MADYEHQLQQKHDDKYLGASVSELHIDRSAKVHLTVCPFVHVSMHPSVRVEHNGHARRKKHVVELYCSCFVAQAQHYATRMNRELRKKQESEQHACHGLERDREPARQRRQREGPEARVL